MEEEDQKAIDSSFNTLRSINEPGPFYHTDLVVDLDQPPLHEETDQEICARYQAETSAFHNEALSKGPYARLNFPGAMYQLCAARYMVLIYATHIFRMPASYDPSEVSLTEKAVP